MRGRQANTLLEARQRTCTQQHRWTEPASDGISTCVACGEERGQLVAPSVDVIDQWSVEQPPSNCQASLGRTRRGRNLRLRAVS